MSSSQLSLAKEYELTNVREAINWYDKAAKLDNIIAQNALARLCRADIDDPDGEAKSQYWEQVVKAKRGEAKELFELGLLQIRGQGTEIDVEAGLENVLLAADKELLEAICCSLAIGIFRSFLSPMSHWKPSCGVSVQLNRVISMAS